jgi:hypothetical protein
MSSWFEKLICYKNVHYVKVNRLLNVSIIVSYIFECQKNYDNVVR